MAKVTTRTGLSEWCLRKLGKPVININVAPEQIEDRIDEALEVYQESHYDATEEVWIAHTITASDVTNGYVTLPSNILLVAEFAKSPAVSSKGPDYKFSLQYRIGADSFGISPYSCGAMSPDMLNYYIINTNYNEMYDLLNTTPRFEFSRHQDRLYIFNGELEEDDDIYIRVFRIIDPETATKIYNDKWLKEYTTQLIKKQWGENLKKHGSIQLLGGVTLNGKEIYDEAVTEIERLEEQLEDKYTEPTDFFMR